jgi:hypothetical protein
LILFTSLFLKIKGNDTCFAIGFLNCSLCIKQFVTLFEVV